MQSQSRGDIHMGEKCRRVEEEAELGTSSVMAEKRCRDVGDGELEFSDSSFGENRRSTRRRVVIEAATESISPAKETNSASDLVSCCSSYASVQLVADRSTISYPTEQTESAQLETLTFSGGRDSEEDESGNMESTAAAAMPFVEANSRRKSMPMPTMPSGVEIDEFLSAAENDLHKRFSEKYNFDVAKGVPLKGRYEWVPVKP